MVNKGHENQTPDFFIRSHLPILLSPLGAPLLLVSVMDRRLAKKLISRNALDEEQHNADFQRIIADCKTEMAAMQVTHVH